VRPRAKAGPFGERGAVKVRDYMSTDVVSIGRAADVSEIASLLKKHSVSGVPVVDEGGRLLGTVSHEEVLSIFIPHYLSMFDELRFLDDLEAIEAQTIAEIEPSLFLAEDIMVPNPVSVRPGTSIMKAAALLLNRKLAFLPVVDERGVVVGVLNRSDVSCAFTTAPAEEG
jgi:CBS domain-containing protein